jgi:hypothetical protein
MIVPLGVTKAAAMTGALCWCGYSAVQQVATSPICRTMRFLCEQRTVGGNTTLLLQQFDSLPNSIVPRQHQPREKKPTTITTTRAPGDYSVCLFGDPIDDQDVLATKRLWKDRLVVKSNGSTRRNKGGLALYGRPRDAMVLSSLSLTISDFIRATTQQFLVVSHPITFAFWMAAMYRLRERGLPWSAPRPGTYYFAFRDYWNFEEEWQLQCQRWCIHNLLLKVLGRSRLETVPMAWQYCPTRVGYWACCRFQSFGRAESTKRTAGSFGITAVCISAIGG